MIETYKVLIIDNDKALLSDSRKYLSKKGYDVTTADCAELAIKELEDMNNNFACVLLDVILPDMNGFDLCKKIRSITKIPIIFVTSMDDENDRITGLLSGGDDYIAKTCSLNEISTRIYSQIRRVTINSFQMDSQTKTVFINGIGVSFALKEYQLIKLFYDNPNEIFSNENIYKKIWNNEKNYETNTIAVHIKRVREKLLPFSNYIGSIQTIRGEGYIYVPNHTKSIKI